MCFKSIHSSQYFENETNGPRQKDPIASKNIIAQNKKKKKDFTGRDLTGEKKKRNNENQSELTEENFIEKISLAFPFLSPLPSSPPHLYFTSIVSFFHSSLYHLNFLLPSSLSLSLPLAPIIFFLPSFFYLALSFFFCTVPRHQSFVGALAGTTSRFEISTARWRNGGGDDVARHPLVFSQSVESYLSLFQAPSSLPRGPLHSSTTSLPR